MPYMDLVIDFITQKPGFAILLVVLAVQFVSSRIPRRA